MKSTPQIFLYLLFIIAPQLATAVSIGTGPLVAVSGAGSPVPNSAACAEGQNWYLQRQAEVEPGVAVNPANPQNMIASYQQDRWENGAAQETTISYTFDGGTTWSSTVVPYQRCLGGKFYRVSDPWVTFSPDGTAYHMVLFWNTMKVSPAKEQTGMAVSRSTDGGVTWSAPQFQATSPSPSTGKSWAHSFFHDKNSITADPNDSRYIYAIWDKAGGNKAPTLVSRSVDGGQSWEKGRVIYNVNSDINSNYASSIGNIIQVMPDGTVAAMVMRYWPKVNQSGAELSWGNADFNYDIALIKSEDHGQTWTKHAKQIAVLSLAEVYDPDWGWFVRGGDIIPSLAVNNVNGSMYVAWQNLHANGHAVIMITASRDGGDTWSTPQVASQTPANVYNKSAMTPFVAVTDNGQVGVFYYDYRNDVANDGRTDTDAWVAVFTDDGSHLNLEGEVRLTDASFDNHRSPWAGGLFLGDYVGLSKAGKDLMAVFTVTKGAGRWNYQPAPGNPEMWVDDDNRTDVVSRRVIITP